MEGVERNLVDDVHEIFETQGDIRGRLAARLKNVHPIDIAVSLQYLEDEEKQAVLGVLEDRVAALVLDETDEETKRIFLEHADEEHLAKLLELMPPDEGADLLELAPEEVEQEVLGHVEEETAQELRELRQYDPDTAGGQMTTEFVTLTEDMTAAEAIRAIQGAVNAEQINWIYVIDKAGKLRGVASIREIISRPPATLISQFMRRDIHPATTDVDQEEVAHMVDRYNLPSVPVTDETGVLKGIITLDDVVDVLSEEASEDLYLLSGTQSTNPITEAVHTRALKRMPWLVVTMSVGLLVMFIYSRYEPLIGQAVWLVFFLPVVQALGGNVGIQSSTVVVRGVATGQITQAGLLRVIGTELAVGLSIGVCFGAVVGVVAALTSAQWVLGIVVSTAILAGVSMSSMSGTMIPLLCNRLGVDPAITAGPFITALNDLLCLSIYFGIATIVLSWLMPAA